MFLSMGVALGLTLLLAFKWSSPTSSEMVQDAFMIHGSAPAQPRCYRSHERIMHGISEAPYISSTWHASLVIKRQIHMYGAHLGAKYIYCSGSMLDSDIFVTCAHCLTQSSKDGGYKEIAVKSDWSVHTNFEGAKKVGEGAERKVIGYAIYPVYELQPSNINNVALVFTLPFTQNDSVRAIGLRDYSDPTILNLNDWKECQLSGTGQILNEDGNCETPQTKSYMAGYFIPRDCCETARTHASESQNTPYDIGTVCFRNTSRMGCNGDSGAGIVCLNDKKERKLVAMHQGGPDCCNQDMKKLNDPQEKVAVFMTQPIIAWIKQQIKMHRKEHMP